MTVAERFTGTGREVILQGFHWDSCDRTKSGGRPWYEVIAEAAPAIAEAGYTHVWFPPPSDSHDDAPQGYLPREWSRFDTPFGSEAQLRAAIAAPAGRGVRAMADLVLNHRVGRHTGGADFVNPAFDDNVAAVVSNDACGCGKGRAKSEELTPYARNLDHTQPGVQKAVREYLDRLKALGFASWRYDMVTGYAGRFVRLYNEHSQPDLSVGEYWEYDRSLLSNWLESAGHASAAFDFPTRKKLFDALNGGDYAGLKSISGKPCTSRATRSGPGTPTC
jgi:alpha-amylase